MQKIYQHVVNLDMEDKNRNIFCTPSIKVEIKKQPTKSRLIQNIIDLFHISIDPLDFGSINHLLNLELAHKPLLP